MVDSQQGGPSDSGLGQTASGVNLDNLFLKGKEQSTAVTPTENKTASGVDINNLFPAKGKGPQPSGSSEDDAYEAKVRSLMPKAQKYVEESGPVVGGPSGAFLEGVGKLGEWTGLRTGVRGAMAALGAGEGKNFSERYEQLKAEDEAVKRAFQEKHPVLTTAGELAGVAAYVPAGIVSAPVEAALAARGAAPFIASAAGMGAEGAAFGAGTAAAEHAFGTDSKQNEPGIVSSALVGGGLGAGLGLGAKAIGKTYETLAPEWIQNLVGGEQAQMKKISKWIDWDKVPDWLAAKEEGKPVSLYNIVNPDNHAELTKIFEGRPEAAKILQDKLATWAGDASMDLREFSNNLLKTKATPVEMQQTAEALAAQRVNQAYEVAKRSGNGAGSWMPEWNNWLNSNTFTEALDKTIADMREKTALRTGNPDNYVPPFQKIEPTELQVDPTDARAMAESYFAKKGVEAPDALEHLGDGLPAGRYQLVEPQQVDIDFLDTLQRNLNRSGKAKMNIENTPSGDLGAEIMKARDKIVDSLTNPKSELYNKDYAEALSAYNSAQRTKDAFTYGRAIWTNATNAAKSSQIADDISRMSPREKFYVAHGLMEEALARVTRPDGSVNTNALNNLLKDGSTTRKAVENALGPRRFEQLDRHIRTQSMLSDALNSAAKYGTGANYDFNAIRTARTLIAYVIPDPAAIASLVYGWAEQAANTRYAKKIATKLASDDLESFKQGLDAIENNKNLKQSLGEYIAKAPRMMGTMAGGRADGGAVHMNEGGAVHMQDGGETPSNVTSLNEVRDQRELQNRYQDFREDLKNRARTFSNATEKAINQGEFEGYNVGDRFLTPKHGPMKITGHLVRRHNPKDVITTRAFERAGTTPTLIEHEGQHFIPMVQYEQGHGDDAQSGHAYLDLIKHAKYPRMGGITRVKRDGGAVQGYAFGGSANEMRMVNKSIHMPKPGDADFVGPTMSNSSYDPNKSGVFDKLNMFGERNIHWTPNLGHVASRGYAVDKTGRSRRSTGGRIPEADKLFKQAKKFVDSHTKQLLNVHDDDIVKALRVAAKKV